MKDEKELKAVEIAKAIQDHLPGTWEVKQDGDSYDHHDRAILMTPEQPRGPDSEAIIAVTARCWGLPAGRVKFVGIFPHGYYPRSDQQKHEITMTIAKVRSPERMAREVDRRLLADYLPALRSARAQRDQELAKHQAKVAKLEEYQDKGYVARVDDRHYRASVVFKGESRGEIQLVRDDQANFEMRWLPFELLERILECIRAFEQEVRHE